MIIKRVQYLKGLNWVFNYYRRGFNNVDPLWYYPYHYAPAFEDLANYIRAQGLQEMNIRTAVISGSVRLSMAEQLLMVLPPQSKEFIPEKYRVLLTSQSPIVDYFPISFEVDKTGIQQEHEYIPLIPFVYPQRLREAMKLINKMRESDPIKENINYLFISND